MIENPLHPTPTSGATSMISSGWRCLVDQEVTRTTLASMPIGSCSLSDCTAQCFLNQLCSVVVYDREACRCVQSGADYQGLIESNMIF